jgi:hypothetical protein
MRALSRAVAGHEGAEKKLALNLGVPKYQVVASAEAADLAGGGAKQEIILREEFRGDPLLVLWSDPCAPIPALPSVGPERGGWTESCHSSRPRHRPPVPKPTSAEPRANNSAWRSIAERAEHPG